MAKNTDNNCCNKMKLYASPLWVFNVIANISDLNIRPVTQLQS